MGVYPPTPALPIIELVLCKPVIPFAGVRSHLFLFGVTPNERGVFVSTVDHFDDDDDDDALFDVLGVAVIRLTGFG